MKNLRDLFIDELKDAYDAEQQIVDALPEMMDASKSQELKDAFNTHLEATKEQVARLEEVFKQLDLKAQRKSCSGMKGLIEEGEEIIKKKSNSDPTVIDAALITAAQRVEHYEVAAYGTLRDYADQLGEKDVAKLLQQTLDEEKRTDKKLTDLAQKINAAAVR